MFDRIKNLLDLNRNGKIEPWEAAIFIFGFFVAGVVLNVWFIE